jgi:hypothetical protein
MPEEDERTYANRLTRNAAEAGSVFTEGALISTFIDGLHPYAGNMVRGQVTPIMTFAEVQIFAEQIGTAGRSLSLPGRYSPRLISTGSVPVRSRTSVAAMAESVVSSPHELPATPVHSSPSALVAATDYAAHSEQGSDLSAVGSDTSFSTRDGASAAGSVHDEAVLAMNERTRNCYLCLRPGHFLTECPLLGSVSSRPRSGSVKPSSGNHLPPLRHPPGPSCRAVSSTGRPESHPQEYSALWP